MYLALISNGMVIRLKIPLKIKIFMWYMYKEVVLTKDNLARIGMGVSSVASFIKMRLSNIYFLSVGTPNLFGAYHILLSMLHHHIVLITCLVVG
jgi:hypothetical protein